MMPASRTNRARTLSSPSPLRSISALMRRHCRSVSTKLGWMQLTCTPSSLPRWASAFEKAAQAALTELPMVKAASGLRPLVPPIVMSEPRRAFSSGQAARASRTWAKNFSAKPSCQSASVRAKKSPRLVVPALLTSTSRWPNSRCTASISFDGACSSHRSTLTTIALRPLPRIVAAVSSSRASSRPVSRRSQPSSASVSAMPRPIPRLDPVTSATFPFSPRSIDCSLFLEVRGHFLLLQVGGEIFLDWNIDEGCPDRRLRGIGIEVLVLDAAGLHRQQHQVAFLPILAFAFDDRIALAFEHVDDEPALVAVLARAGLDVMDEDAPLLQRRLLERHRVEKELELALPRLEPFLPGAVDHHGSGEIALGERFALRHHALIGVVPERRPLALAHAFDFSHCSCSSRVGPIFGRIFELLEAAAAIDRHAFKPVRLSGDELRGVVRVGIEVLNDDAVGAQWQIEHVARFPGMFDAIDRGVAAPFRDHHHLPTLELEPPRAAAGRDFLLIEQQHRET